VTSEFARYPRYCNFKADLDMISVDLNPDKQEPNREEYTNGRLNPVNFENWGRFAT